MRRISLALLVLTALLAAAVPAAAHPTSVPAAAPDPTNIVVVVAALPDHLLVAGAPAPALPWTALAMLAALTAAAAWRPRPAVAIALVLVVGVLAFETGVHAAHHLGDDSPRCVIAWMSSQLSGATLDATIDTAPAVVDAARISAPTTVRDAGRALAPDAGRAPPG
jgi:hypothetical protein